MATDTNKFKIFLEKYYDSTFNTRRSGINNPITKVNSCVFNVINEFINPQIKDFELSMPQECYTTLSENPSTDEIKSCISKYGQFDEGVLNQIQTCLSLKPITTTTTTRRPFQECTGDPSFESTAPGCVGYTDCCGVFRTISVDVGTQFIIDCVQIGSIVQHEDKNCTPKANIQNISYVGSKCGCTSTTTTTTTLPD